MSWDESQGSSGPGWQQPHPGQGGQGSDASFGQGAQWATPEPTQPFGQGAPWPTPEPTQPYGQGPQWPTSEPTQPYGSAPQQPASPYPYGAPVGDGSMPPHTRQFGDYQQYQQQGQQYQDYQQYQQFPQQYPTAPAPKKGKGPIIAAVVGVVVVAGAVGGYFALSGSSNDGQANASSTSSTASAAHAGGSSSISLPGSAAGQVLLSTDTAKQETERVKDGVVSGGSSVYVNPLVGSYGPSADGGYRLVLVVEPFSHMSAEYQSQLKNSSPEDTVEQFATAAHMSDAKQEPSTDSDTAIVCGTLAASSEDILTCVWIDSESLGIAYYYNAYYTTSESAAAKDTDELRAAAEAG